METYQATRTREEPRVEQRLRRDERRPLRQSPEETTSSATAKAVGERHRRWRGRAPITTRDDLCATLSLFGVTSWRRRKRIVWTRDPLLVVVGFVRAVGLSDRVILCVVVHSLSGLRRFDLLVRTCPYGGPKNASFGCGRDRRRLEVDQNGTREIDLWTEPRARSPMTKGAVRMAKGHTGGPRPNLNRQGRTRILTTQ